MNAKTFNEILRNASLKIPKLPLSEDMIYFLIGLNEIGDYEYSIAPEFIKTFNFFEEQKNKFMFFTWNACSMSIHEVNEKKKFLAIYYDFKRNKGIIYVHIPSK